MFVFWYCHKRGKEVRLDKERELTEAEMQQLEKEYHPTDGNENPTTTADEGASMEEVQAGIRMVQVVKEAAAEQDSAMEQPASSDAKVGTASTS